MNKVLLKAAVILNIAAASLIYVACSGDDGDRGDPGPAGAAGDSCTAVPSIVSPGNGYDIMCGGELKGTVLNGTATAKGDPGAPGAPGAGCYAEGASGGVNIICGTNPPVLLPSGTSGGITPDGCTATSTTVSGTGDPAINVRCPDSRSTTIVVCPGGSKAQYGSQGFLFDEDGKAARCLADGTISRDGQVAVLSCGGASFDPAKEFCQNTFIAGDTAGLFAEVTGTGASERLVVGSYPQNYANVKSPTSSYNKSTGRENVKSEILPLCGTTPAASNATDAVLSTKHIYNNLGVDDYNPLAGAKNTVYSGKQYCARNLVIKSTSYKPGTTTALEGGLLDNNPASPYGAGWSVRAAGSCPIDLNAAGDGSGILGSDGLSSTNINGFTFVTSATITSPHWLARPCDFVEASPGAVPSCPPDRPVVSLDDVKCVAREQCVYHSIIDNTCVVKEGELTSLYGHTANVIQPHVEEVASGLVTPATIFIAKYAAAAANTSPGIVRTPVGSRFGTARLLQPASNLWSKGCKTLSRTNYYAVNDPYLTNKDFKDANPLILSGTPNPSTSVLDDIEPPICEDLTPQPGINPPVITQAAVSFETAFACIRGSLSVDVQGGNTGLTWDKPLYCVLDEYTSDRYCAVSGTGITQANCPSGGINAVSTTGSPMLPIGEGLTMAKRGGTDIASNTIRFTWSGGVCRVSGPAIENSGTPTQALCQGITGLSIGVSDPITVSGTIRGRWINNNSCEVYNSVVVAIDAPAIDKSNCEAPIDKLWYGNNNPVLGTISASWTLATGSFTLSSTTIKAATTSGTETVCPSTADLQTAVGSSITITGGELASSNCTAISASTNTGSLSVTSDDDYTAKVASINTALTALGATGVTASKATGSFTLSSTTIKAATTSGTEIVCPSTADLQTAVGSSITITGGELASSNCTAISASTNTGSLSVTSDDDLTIKVASINTALTALGATGVTASKTLFSGSYCKVSSSHSSALDSKENCSQITAAAKAAYKAEAIEDVNFYWVQ